MKLKYFLLLLLLSVTTSLFAQTDDYKPFVEQGKRWYCHHRFWSFWEGDFHDNYQYVIRGEERVWDKTYARVLKYAEGQDESQAELFCLVREEGHCVYVRNSQFYYQYHITADMNEILLYDFDDPSSQFRYGYEDSFKPVEDIQGRKAFKLGHHYIVEGIGLDNDTEGDPFMFFTNYYTSGDYRYYYGLRYVEDAGGNIIYKGSYYDQFPPVSGLTANKIRDEKLKVRTEEGKLVVEATSAGVVELVNAAGVVVGRDRVEEGFATVSTAGLTAGVYLVQLSTPTGRQTAKIVVR